MTQCWLLLHPSSSLACVLLRATAPGISVSFRHRHDERRTVRYETYRIDMGFQYRRSRPKIRYIPPQLAGGPRSVMERIYRLIESSGHVESIVDTTASSNASATCVFLLLHIDERAAAIHCPIRPILPGFAAHNKRPKTQRPFMAMLASLAR